MANEVTNTEGSAQIPESWVQDVVGALYDHQSLFSRVTTKPWTSKKGDIVHFAVWPTLTRQAVSTTDGSVTANTPTLTDVSLTLDKHYAVLLEALSLTRTQSFDDWWNSLPGQAREALLSGMDTDILALGSGFTSNTAVGAGTDHVDENMITAMIGTLVRANVPIIRAPEECTFVFDGKEYEYLKRANLLDYSRTGKPGGGAAEVFSERIYQVPFIQSNNVQTSSSINQNLLFHKTAICAAVQEDIRMEYGSGLANRKLTQIFSAATLYGVKELVDARAVRGLTTDA